MIFLELSEKEAVTLKEAMSHALRLNSKEMEYHLDPKTFMPKEGHALYVMEKRRRQNIYMQLLEKVNEAHARV